MLSSETADPFVQQLNLAADAFVIRRADGASSLIAGYHWFTDWGRDAMISLPGLALTTGRFELAKDILSSFLKCSDQGMLPNRFPDRDGAPEFNTVDATLWLFHAVHQYLLATGDLAFLRDEAFPKLEEVIDWHMKGTRYGIRMDAADGLLSAGESGVQLTWMDAKIGDWVVTPRQGKAVEINALWHNAMRVMESFSRKLKNAERTHFYEQLASVIQRSFNQVFWNAEAHCLFDCIQGGVPDKRIRPNQIFAVSLPHAAPVFRQSPSRGASGDGEAADTLRIAQPGSWRSRLPPRLPRKWVRTRQCLSPGDRLGMADWAIRGCVSECFR